MESIRDIASVKENGKCPYCGAMLKIQKVDHTFLRTQRYAKFYKGGKAVIKCPDCKKEILANLN